MIFGLKTLFLEDDQQIPSLGVEDHYFYKANIKWINLFFGD